MDQEMWKTLNNYDRYEHSHEELEHLKAKISMFWEFLNKPMARHFFLLNFVRDEFEREFGEYVKSLPKV